MILLKENTALNISLVIDYYCIYTYIYNCSKIRSYGRPSTLVVSKCQYGCNKCNAWIKITGMRWHINSPGDLFKSTASFFPFTVPAASQSAPAVCSSGSEEGEEKKQPQCYLRTQSFNSKPQRRSTVGATAPRL